MGFVIFCEQHPRLTLTCGIFIITKYARLVWENHTYELRILWFTGFAKRNGLSKVMTRRVLMFISRLKTLAVIEIQRITSLIFLRCLSVSPLSWWLHLTVTHPVKQKGLVSAAVYAGNSSSRLVHSGVKHPSISFEGGIRPLELSFLFFNEDYNWLFL
ncbi:hypothetical protein C5167_027610 [Papaver somniferum]|nr:hypothetical protein C5167_027610 [Papaver somniferum]